MATVRRPVLNSQLTPTALFTAKFTEVAPRLTVFHLPLPLSRHEAQALARAAKVAVARWATGAVIETAPNAWQPRLEAELLRA